MDTPTRLTPSSPPAAPLRLRRSAILWGLLGLSLALHVLTLSGVLAARGTAKQEGDQLLVLLDEAATSSFALTIPVRDTIPVVADVPVRLELDVPIRLSIPIQQNVDLPINTPLGSTSISIPLNLTVPISTTVPIVIDRSIAINTSVVVDTDIPVAIDVAKTPFGGYLQQIREQLARLLRAL